MWQDALGAYGSYNACLNMTNHYGRLKKDATNMTYYFEKVAILGSVETRLFLGKHHTNMAGDVDEGIKHFVTSTKQGDP